jgi:DNA-binding transcriptional ArsR family regulator
MPMEIYGENNEPEINVFNSPVIELVCALHLLTDAAHHQFELKWAEEILAGFNENEKKALEIIKLFPANGIELLNFVLDSGELLDIEAFLKHIESSDVVDFFFYILNEQIEKSKISRAFSEIKERYKIQEKIKWLIDDNQLMDFFQNYENIKQKTILILSTIAKKGFAEKLLKSQERMEGGIEYIKSYLGKDTIDSVLEKVSGRPRKYFAGFREYNIIPSYFVSPRFIRVFSGDRLYVVFDCRVTRDKTQAMLEELSTILKVIDDKSRLEMLKILVNNKSYGKAIADVIGISTPTVSHHLDILKQSGFVKEEKIRNIKYFYADKEKLKKVIDDLNKYFFSAE